MAQQHRQEEKLSSKNSFIFSVCIMDFRHWAESEAKRKTFTKKILSIKRKTFKYFIAIFVHFHSGSRQAKTELHKTSAQH